MKNAGGVSHRENTRITSGRQGDLRQGSRPSKEPVKAALLGRSRVQCFTNTDGTVKQWAPAGGGETMARQASGKGWRSAARKRPQKGKRYGTRGPKMSYAVRGRDRGNMCRTAFPCAQTLHGSRRVVQKRLEYSQRSHTQRQQCPRLKGGNSVTKPWEARKKLKSKAQKLPTAMEVQRCQDSTRRCQNTPRLSRQ